MASQELRPSGVVAVGASAGGVEALTTLAAGLPADCPHAILVVLHLPANAPSVLARIVDRAGPLPAAAAVDGEPLRRGHIHVAVPDHHLLVDDDHVVLSEGPTENTHRPAINALFRSVALRFGPRAVGVLMSGVLDDGVQGMNAIRARGGATIVQSLDDALFPAMPRNALATGSVQHQVSAAGIGALIADLAGREIEDLAMEPDAQLELENRIAMGPRFSAAFTSDALGPPSGFTCPDCNGSLLTVREGSYRCQVGHAWTAEALLSARDDEVENALWIALRSLGEKVRLSRRLADNVGEGAMQQRYTELADEAERAMEVLATRLSEDPVVPGERGNA